MSSLRLLVNETLKSMVQGRAEEAAEQLTTEEVEDLCDKKGK